MPKTRTEVAHKVAACFLPVERTAIRLAADTHRCVATMMEERGRARIGKTEGSLAITRASEAAHHAVLAANALLEAHQELRDLGVRHGLETAFGPESAHQDAGNVVHLADVAA